MNEYEKKAEDFLKRNNIQFKAVLKNKKSPPWSTSTFDGHHYIVRMSGHTPFGLKRKLSLKFWGSIYDKERGTTDVTPYDVLSCISFDVSCPEKFDEFCDEYGYNNDSIEALKTFRRCNAWRKKLRKFFSEKEIEELQEIQ